MMLHAQHMPDSPRPRWFSCTVFLAIAANGSRLVNSFTAVRGFILTYRDMVIPRLFRSAASLPMSSDYCALR
ncbi:hypothetical protein KCP77_10105 [Salmonella enterica subsp. enterica]|nr:hypothetical protein KCP77_10105 [Salmonella enterica subsp. enterica]